MRTTKEKSAISKKTFDTLIISTAGFITVDGNLPDPHNQINSPFRVDALKVMVF